MIAKLRSWCKAKALEIFGFAVILLIVIVLIYIGRVYGAGLDGYTQISIAHTIGKITRTEVSQPGKTLWDWLQLLIIPVVLAIGGYFFNLTVSRNEREIALDNQREDALQQYIDKMSELLLNKNLRESQPENEVRKIARVRTLTILPRLDANRKRSVLQFLYESGLLAENEDTQPIINLKDADFSGANLRSINFPFANLSGSNLSFTNLENAKLIGANLNKTELDNANLSNTNLKGAKLSEAIVTPEQLKTVKSLQGATMPDGSRHL